MSATYPVFLYDSSQTGAPRCSGTAGDMIAVLDGCLIDGFNTKTITITRTGDVATASCTGHGYREHDILLVAGADQSAYNGTSRISNVTANTFDFDVAGEPVTPATGTITAKVAPAGWEKRYSGTNKAVYRSNDVTSTQLNLRIDDTNARYAWARGYETMTGVDAGANLFPTTVQSANGLAWEKSSTANTTARTWFLICDSKILYLFVAWDNSYLSEFDFYRFGDIISCRTDDAFHCSIHGNGAASPAYPGIYLGIKLGSNIANLYFARSGSQIGGSINTLIQYAGYEQGLIGSGGYTYPNSFNNGIILYWPIRVSEGGTAFRGSLPGIISPMHYRPLSSGSIITDVPGLSDRRILPLDVGSGSSLYRGQIMLDITGPWR